MTSTELLDVSQSRRKKRKRDGRTESSVLNRAFALFENEDSLEAGKCSTFYHVLMSRATWLGISCLYNGVVADKDLLHQYLCKDPSCGHVVRLLDNVGKESQDLDKVLSMWVWPLFSRHVIKIKS